MEYDRVANNIRRMMGGEIDIVPHRTASEKLTRQPLNMHEIVRCATLAASSHNTQPWKFLIDDDDDDDEIIINAVNGGHGHDDGAKIRIVPDLSRRCPVVDPDDSHLYKSLGCAAENIVHAAAAQGFQAKVSCVGEDATGDHDDHHVAVDLYRRDDGTKTVKDELYHAIFQRQCTKMVYDGTRLSEEELKALQNVIHVDGEETSNVRIIFLTSEKDKQRVIEFVNQGNIDQLTDPSWRRELVSWIRFNPREALDTGDGLAGRTGGSPSIPSWLGRLMAGWIITPSGQVKTDTTNIESSAGVAVFVSGDDRSSWVRVGQVYERFALQATALRIRTAFINQPIEVRKIRPDFESWLGLQDEEHAQLMVRYGHGPVAPYSLRRPPEDVMMTSK